MVKAFSKDILKNLRDGDWKQRPASASFSSEYDSATSSGDAMDMEGAGAAAEEVEDIEDDKRIEGTTAYLPPEVVLGAFPTVAADAWALGCVTYQCLSGRPPLLEADDEATRNRIVSFDGFGANKTVSETKNEVDRLFEDSHASSIPVVARDMIKSLLDRNPLKRPGMNQIAECDFFTVNVFALYSQPAYPLDVGSVSPVPNSNWARRQYSSIWAALPEAYNVSLPEEPNANDTRFPGPFTDAPIAEGEEATGFFSSSGNLPSTAAESLGKRPVRTMPLPPS